MPGNVLVECLFCLIYQKCKNYEVICADDCSDKIGMIETKYKKRIPKYVIYDPLSGIADNTHIIDFGSILPIIIHI